MLNRLLLDRHAQLTAELAALREGAAAHDALEREVAGGMEHSAASDTTCGARCPRRC